MRHIEPRPKFDFITKLFLWITLKNPNTRKLNSIEQDIKWVRNSISLFLLIICFSSLWSATFVTYWGNFKILNSISLIILIIYNQHRWQLLFAVVSKSSVTKNVYLMCFIFGCDSLYSVMTPLGFCCIK